VHDEELLMMYHHVPIHISLPCPQGYDQHIRLPQTDVQLEHKLHAKLVDVVKEEVT
jgi:hypothetical protein